MSDLACGSGSAGRRPLPENRDSSSRRPASCRLASTASGIAPIAPSLAQPRRMFGVLGAREHAAPSDAACRISVNHALGRLRACSVTTKARARLAPAVRSNLVRGWHRRNRPSAAALRDARSPARRWYRTRPRARSRCRARARSSARPGRSRRSPHDRAMPRCPRRGCMIGVIRCGSSRCAEPARASVASNGVTIMLRPATAIAEVAMSAQQSPRRAPARSR